MLYSVFPICGYMDLHLNLPQDSVIKDVFLRRYNCEQINILQLNILGSYMLSTGYNVVTSLRSILEAILMSKDVWNVLMTNHWIVTSKDHTLSCLSIGSFLLRMSAFLYLTNRMKNSFGEMKRIFLGNGDEQS